MGYELDKIVYNGSLPDEVYNQLLDDNNILDQWVLTSTPLPLVYLVMYLAAIYLGSIWMKNREPFDLTLIMRLYNIFQIFFNTYIISSLVHHPEAIRLLMEKSCSMDYQGVDLIDLRYAYVYYGWGFLLSKIIDLLDTIFMVLRKKNSHITFLHVYHHVAMVGFTWVTLKYAKAVQGALPGLFNVCVHIIMYTYYFLATFGPAVEKYLWWKRHLTKLQLAQFAGILFYLLALYYHKCPIPKVFTYIWVFNLCLFTCLFLDFYFKTYIFKSYQNEKEDKKDKVS